MPAPAAPTYAPAVLVSAHTAFRDFIDSGAGAGYVNIRDNADVLLAVIPLNDPSGTINGTTGQLTFSFNGRDESADASGTAAYAEFCNSTGTVYLSIPAVQGVSPVSGFLVMNTLSVLAGGPVEMLSATVG